MKKNAKEVVAQKLDELMNAFPDLGTQQKLAKKTGIGQTTIGRIRRGEVNATADNLRLIAGAFGVPVGYLYDETDIGKMTPQERSAWYSNVMKGSGRAPTSNIEQGPEARGFVPVISWVTAGTWCDAVDPYEPGVAEEWLPCPVSHSSNTFALQVRGVSMEPRYQDGDIIFVDPHKHADNGARVIVRLDDKKEATFKQLIIEGDRKYLKALNPAWPEPIIEINGNATICGVVIGKWVPE